MGQYKDKLSRFGGAQGGEKGVDRYTKRDFGTHSSFKNNRNESRKDFSGRADLHKATCSDCGDSCEVPFRPTGEKPVYCNNCFAQHRGSEKGGFARGERKEYSSNPIEHHRGTRRPDSRPGDNSALHDLKRRVEELHTKLDRVLDVMHTEKLPATSEIKSTAKKIVPTTIKKEVSVKKDTIVKKGIQPLEKKKALVKKKVITKKKK